MQKEAFIAIIVGLFLGLSVTAGIYYIKTKKHQTQVVKSEEKIIQPAASPTPSIKNLLTINAPLDGLITLAEKVNVGGNFKPKAYLVSSVNDTITIAQLDSNTFKFIAQIKPGPNMIYVVGIDNEGNTHEQSRLVVGEMPEPTPPESTSAAKLKNATSSAQEPLSSDSAQLATASAILARINKKLGKNGVGINQKRAVLGQIARVTTESITITNDQGSFIFPIGDVKLFKKDKPVKVDSVAIDQWALAIGEINKEDANTTVITPKTKFKPKKIEIYEKKPIPDKPTVLIGTLDEFKRNQLTIITRKDSQKQEVLLSSKTFISDINDHEIKKSDLEKDLSLIIVAVPNHKDQLVAQHIKALVAISDELK